jgi:hypothetical protein
MEFMETLAPIVELSVVYVLLFTTGRSPARAELAKRGRATIRRRGQPPAPRLRLSLWPPDPSLESHGPEQKRGDLP